MTVEHKRELKHAVVTGAGSGIGRSCAIMLAQQGWIVYALEVSGTVVDPDSLQPASGSGRIIPVRCDVTSSSEVIEAFAKIQAETSTLHAVICSAGILRPSSLAEMDELDFDKTFAVNVKGAWLTARSAIPLLEKYADRNSLGRIVILGSAAALRPKIGGGAYAASKIAVSYIGRVLAAELAAKKILVNVIAPATVDTEMTRALAARPGYKLSGESPLGRIGQPEDVVGLIQFLLSDAASYISGAVIPVDGATTAAYSPAS
ncbi:SDR family NAD(P)-dependent oxidoreductase [Pseudochelatococcus sp. B33]